MSKNRKLLDSLRNGTPKQVLRQHARHFESIGGLQPPVPRESRTIATGLTRSEATAFLSRLANKIIDSGIMLAMGGESFVVGWHREAGPDVGTNLGLPIEVWACRSTGRTWKIVDRSTAYYQLPWMAGVGWLIGPGSQLSA